MATYNLAPALQSFYHPTDGVNEIASAAAARTYANGDIVVLTTHLRWRQKITGARVAAAQLDSNGSPTAAGVLEIIDGVTTTTLVTVTAASLGTAGGSLTGLTNPAAYNYIVQTKEGGATVRFRFTAGPATAASGRLALGVAVTGLLFSNEDPMAPAG